MAMENLIKIVIQDPNAGQATPRPAGTPPPVPPALPTGTAGTTPPAPPSVPPANTQSATKPAPTEQDYQPGMQPPTAKPEKAEAVPPVNVTVEAPPAPKVETQTHTPRDESQEPPQPPRVETQTTASTSQAPKVEPQTTKAGSTKVETTDIEKRIEAIKKLREANEELRDSMDDGSYLETERELVELQKQRTTLMTTAANEALRASLADGTYLKNARETVKIQKDAAALQKQAAHQEAVAKHGKVGAATRGAAIKVTKAASVAQRATAGAGNIAATSAANSGAAFGKAVDAASMGLSKLGPYGMAAAAGLQTVTTAAGAFTSIVKSFADRGKELEQYSGATASAGARAEVNQMKADMREAQVLGDRMAKMIEKQDQADRTMRELLLPVKEFMLDKLLQFMNNVIDFMKSVLKFFGEGGALIPGPVKDWANKVLATLNTIAGEANGPVDLLDDWLKAGTRAGLGPNNQAPPPLPPLFGGLNFGQFNP